MLQGQADPAVSDWRDEARYQNRELSWLSFNRRVLAESCNEAYPLLERLRFLAISASNLDEFIMIRVAGLEGQARRGIDHRSLDGRTPSGQLAAIRKEVSSLEHDQQDILSNLRDRLAEQKIRIAAADVLNEVDRDWLQNHFVEHIAPVITPQAIDPAHPFPFVSNRGLGMLFRTVRRADQAPFMEMVLLPSTLDRFIRVPGEEAVFVPVESVLSHFAEMLFPGFDINGHGLFRVLRDSDIEIAEEAEDLVRFFRSAIQRRRRGRVVLLELQKGFDPEAGQFLEDKLGSTGLTVSRTNQMLGLASLSRIVEEARPDLKFDPFTPRYPERILEHDGDCFAAISEKEILVHHPYENFEVVVDFLRQASEDPDVVSIKQTLYRAGAQSPVVAALIAAAEAGKSVTAVIELKARFDEEQNLHWAAQLERAGVQVIYGFVEWKTHAKVSMVVRREGGGYRTYCHFGTGNYHPVTAKIYTDLSYFTADPRIGRDAARLFNFITGYIEPPTMEVLSVAPLNMREKLYELIDAEIDNARGGKPSGIWAKLNSLTERGIINRLYAASEAGVPITLVIRGICCLRPGIAGLSETIVVKSIIGRFLEHSRIWAFSNGAELPGPQAKVFMSSADAMSRNLSRRVELLIPLLNRTVHQQVLNQVMLANIIDTEQSWHLGADGTYRRAGSDGEGFNLHRYFIENPSLSGRGAAADSESVPRLALCMNKGER